MANSVATIFESVSGTFERMRAVFVNRRQDGRQEKSRLRAARPALRRIADLQNPGIDDNDRLVSTGC